MAYKIKYRSSSVMKVNNSLTDIPLERKLERMISNGEPIDSNSLSPIFTDKKDGVEPAYNVRTDRFEIAVDATDKVSKSNLAKSEAKMFDLSDKSSKDGGAESRDGTD